MRFSVSCQHLPSAVRAFTSFLAEINSPTYDIAIRECDTNSVIHDVAGRKSELGVVAIHEPHMRSMQTLFSSYDIEKCQKLCVSPFWSSTGFSSCPFYKGSGKISFRYLRPRIGNFPFLRRTAVLQAFK